MTAVERVRDAVRQMRDEAAAWDQDEPESRFLLALVRLVELAADDAAGVEAMNERTRQRAERVGGDGHTWVMHRPEWSVALQATAAWTEAHQ